MISFSPVKQKEAKIPLSNGMSILVNTSLEGSLARISINAVYCGVYGLGERFDSVNLIGRRCETVVTEKFCNQGDKTYCPIPFFFTDGGLGIGIDTDQRAVFDFTGKDLITCEIQKDAKVCVFSGTPEEMIGEWNGLMGSVIAPPEYAFGPWISANRWKSREDVENARENLRKYDIPATVLVLEAWSDESTFYIFNGAKYRVKAGNEALAYEDFDFEGTPWPDPKGMIEELKKDGIATVLWQIPVYKKCTAEDETEQNTADAGYALNHKLCVFTADGEPYRIPEGNWFAGSLIPDFTREETRRIWLSKRKYLLEMGVAGFKTDGGEFIYREDLSFADGRTGKEMKNAYCQSYIDTYYDFIGTDHILFSRAGYKGASRTPILWAGDHESTNDELKNAYTAAISAASSGIMFWSFDIGGFAGLLPDADLYLRSTMFGCFCPVMQWHSEPDGGQFKDILAGAEGNNERSPWNMAKVCDDPKLLDKVRFFHKLRMKLIPYLYQTAKDSAAELIPMMRPLFWYAGCDSACADVWDEYFLGDSLLVAPLLEKDEMVRSVYLPEGRYTGLFSGREYAGGVTVSSEAETFPVFVKIGAKNAGLIPKMSEQ